jgi:hypothetical protein
MEPGFSTIDLSIKLNSKGSQGSFEKEKGKERRGERGEEREERETLVSQGDLRHTLFIRSLRRQNTQNTLYHLTFSHLTSFFINTPFD